MIHVKLHNKILDNKTSVVVFIPLFLWVFVLLGTLFLMFAMNYYYLVPVLGIGFLCIIPVFFICKARVNKAFKVLEGDIFEADLEIRDRKLYYGKQELEIKYNKRTGIVSLTHEMVAGKYMTRAYSFWATVDDEDKESFLELCRFYHLSINRRN